MKTLLALLLLFPVAVRATAWPALKLAGQPWQVRVGFDSNPAGSGGSSEAVWGGDDTLVYAAGTGFTLLLPAASAENGPSKLGYQGEWVRFDNRPEENFSTHRFSMGTQFDADGWKFLAEGSALYIAGSTDTLPSLSTINANAVTLWRERRRQWQHRLKLQAVSETGTRLVRATGTLLACDYHTDVAAGKVAFTDRADAQAGIDLGWKHRPRSLWFAGLRAGRQTQAVVPLPESNFDYGSNYQRIVLGWEGRLPAGTSLSFAAGPDFRHYSGAIDPRVFTGGRDRTSLWFETSLTAKPHPAWTLSAKATRFAWLSSTGKSAYFDSSAEAAATWAPRDGWSLRASARMHGCDYFPARRNDWESLVGLGATKAWSPRIQLTLDVLRHRAWNELPATAEREFRRLVVQFATTIAL